MIRCAECFDEELGIQILSDRVKQVQVVPQGKPAKRCLVILTCTHGQERRHVVYRSASDWQWALSQAHKKGGQNGKNGNGARR